MATLLELTTSDNDLRLLTDLVGEAANRSNTQIPDRLGDAATSLTLLAPTDAAFVALANDLGFEGSDRRATEAYLTEALTQLGNGDFIEGLLTILTYHVVIGEVDPETDMVLTTLSGALGLAGGALSDADDNTPDVDLPDPIAADNGTLFKIDAVLRPSPLPTIQLRTNGSDADDLIFGGDASDLIQAGTGDDEIYSGAESDRVFGEAGADQIWAGDGDDTLDGGGGNDRIFGDRDNDNISGRAGDDTLNGGNGDDLILGGIGSDRLFGNSGNDTLRGADGEDRLIGRQGDDILQGGNGNDVINSGSGDDRATGGEGRDRLFANSGDDTMRGGAGNDLLFGADGADLLRGGSQSDTIFGGDGDDTLSGEDGHDRLVGNGGDDVMTGGDLTDRFVFTTNDGDRTVTDFTSGEDLLLLTALPEGATYDTAVAGDDLLITTDANPDWSIRLLGITELSEGDQMFL